MDDRSWFLPSLAPVEGKPVKADFDGGWRTADADTLLLAGITQRLAIARRLAQCLTDARAPEHIQHTLAEIDPLSDADDR